MFRQDERSIGASTPGVCKYGVPHRPGDLAGPFFPLSRIKERPGSYAPAIEYPKNTPPKRALYAKHFLTLHVLSDNIRIVV